MRIKILLVLLLCNMATIAQSKDAYLKKIFVSGSDTMPYRLLLPADYDPDKKYPLILLLHGSGERGNDNEAQLTHVWKLFLTDSIRKAFPAIVVFPQCSANSYWSNVQFVYDSTTKKRTFKFQSEGAPTTAMQLLLGLLQSLQNEYKLDKGRLYVGGLSMGGMGTFELVRRKPKMFAAAFPICGGGNTGTAKKLKGPAWWIFHGAKDEIVPHGLSAAMADALKNTGGDVKLTIYPEVNHNSWDNAFAEKDLLPWLFSKRK